MYMSRGINGNIIVLVQRPLCNLYVGENFNVWFDPYYEDKIGIDGGLGPFENGQLNCLCLNDMSVTVIKKTDMAEKKEAV